MSDESLFALNERAGRKVFICNSVILGIISVASTKIINLHIKPNIMNQSMVPAANIAEAVIYSFFLFLLVSLFERRIKDITNNEKNIVYKFSTSLCYISLLMHIYIYLCQSNLFSASFRAAEINVMAMCNIFDMILLIMFIIICLIPGKFTH